MSAKKDKPGAPAGKGKPATKTVVGVPALPSEPPSGSEGNVEVFSREEVPTAQSTAQQADTNTNNASAAKSGSTSGAPPKPATQGTRIKTPAVGAEIFPGLTRPSTRAGVGSPAPVAPHGRSTAPPSQGVAGETDGEAGRPPIVVPAAPSSGNLPPKAVAQPPPRGEGAARVDPAIPKGPASSPKPEPSVEELSGSLLLPDASGEAPAQSVEELSGSVLIEDGPDGAPVVKPASPSAGPAPRTPSVKPPVPKSARPAPATQGFTPAPAPAAVGPAAQDHRTLLGGTAPPVPQPTPPPKLDYVPSASGEPMAIPVPDPVPDPFAGVQWMPPPPAGAQGPQASAPPSTSPLTGDVELNQLPRGGIEPLLDASKRYWKRFLELARRLLEDGKPLALRLLEKAKQLAKRAQEALPQNTVLRFESRPVWFFWLVAGAGLLVGIGLVGLVVSAVRTCARPTEGPSTSSSASASLATSEVPGAALPQATTAPAPAAPLPACTVIGPPHVIGPNATVAAGVEVVRAADDLAIGFAPDDHEAMAVRVDPASVQAISSARATSHDLVKRVTPVVSAKGALSLVLDTDRKNERLQGRRTVLASPPVQLGMTTDGHVSWSRLGGPPAGQLWPIDSGDAIDAIRGAVNIGGGGTQSVAVVFRRAASVWMGALDDSGSSVAMRGDLSHVDGLGTAVGSPAIAVSDGVVLAAWSDRASSDAPWQLRWVRFPMGQAIGPANAFVPPAGGRGEQAMSPGIAALPGGRFLLVWTEGPQSGHDVRGLTLGPDGAPIGAPLTLSTAGVNAGQGQTAVTESGAGIVAFLQTGGGGFEVVATPVSCGRP